MSLTVSVVAKTLQKNTGPRLPLLSGSRLWQVNNAESRDQVLQNSPKAKLGTGNPCMHNQATIVQAVCIKRV